MTVNLDADPENADWTKRYTWDIPATTADELYAYLAQRGITVEHFKTLPVYQVNQYRFPWLQDIQQPPPQQVSP